MSYTETRLPHPLCTCPELTWDMVTGRAPAPDLDACRSRSPLGIDPHPVIDLAELGLLEVGRTVIVRRTWDVRR